MSYLISLRSIIVLLLFVSVVMMAYIVVRYVSVHNIDHEMIFAFLISTGLLLWLSFHILVTTRINRLLELTAKVAKGDLSARSGLTGKDGIGRLAQSLDDMVISLAVNQHELKINEERLRISQENAGTGSWELNLKTNDLVWSETVFHIFDCSDEDVKTYDDFIRYVHPDEREELKKSIQHCIDTGEKYDFVHRIVRSDGSIRWVHEQGDVAGDTDGARWRMLGIVRDITDKKEARLLLQATLRELKYHKYAIDQHSIVAVTDLSGRITYSNDKFTEISGYTNRELFGKTHRIINSGFHPKEFFTRMWLTISSGKIWHGEVCNRNKNGELYWVETTIVPHLDENDKPDRYIAIRTDITERVLSQQATAEERGLLEVINDVQSQFLRDGQAKAGFENLLQATLSATESEYGFVGEVFYTDENHPYIKMMALTNIAWDEESKAVYEKHASNGIEFRNLNTLFGNVLTTGKPVISNNPADDPRSGGIPEGHPPLNSFMGVPLYTGNKMVGVVGIANRSTGYDESILERLQPLFTTCARFIDACKIDALRKHADVQLHLQASALEAVADGIVITDKNGNIEWVNPAYTDLTGYSADEVLGKNPRILKSGKHSQDFYKKLWQTILSGDTWHGELWNKRKDGSLYQEEQSITPVLGRDGEVNHYIAVKRDVSERQKLQQQLQQAQKMEAIGHLTGGIAHDFNNMLASIMGYTELASERIDKKGDKKVKSYLAEVYKSGTRARDLVAQMLAFSRGGEGEIKPFILAPLIKESLKMLATTLPSSMEIDLKIDDSSLTVETNPVQLHQMIMNLCINSRDSMSGKGELSIGLKQVRLKKVECVSCHKKISGDFVQVSVKDTGSGIKPEQMGRLFDPFYTTKEIGKGTGMGLSMVHGIMHDHGGHILLETFVDKGTTFSLLFPSSSNQVYEEDEEYVAIKKETVAVDGNILVVDDEPSVGRFIGEILKLSGYSVTVETDSRIAMKKFRENPSAYHLIVTDQTMPGMTGIELARSILEIRPDFPIVLCTGYSEHVDEDIATSIGISAYVSKPIKADEFVVLTGDLLQGKKT